MGENGSPPLSTNTFSVPNCSDLWAAYNAYKLSPQTRLLYSEQNRKVFPEAFVENVNHGTLADLCVRALAKLSAYHISPLVKKDPLKLNIHYDSIDVNLPLKDCYFVESLSFWRRVVLTNTNDVSLQLKKENEYDWRSKGISMKLIEMVEDCPAEFWSDSEVGFLAGFIKPYVKELHLKKLKSLKERSFEQYKGSESDTESSESSESEEISSDELSTDPEAIYEEHAKEVHLTPPLSINKKRLAVSGTKLKPAKESSVDEKRQIEEDYVKDVHLTPPLSISMERLLVAETQLRPAEESPIDETPQNDEVNVEVDKLQLINFEPIKNIERRRARAARNKRRQVLREAKSEAKALRAQRRHIRQVRRKRKMETPKVHKIKRPEKVTDSVFDIEVAPEPDDGEREIIDERNIEKLLRLHRRYKYPPEHCHHIDLSFIRHFDNLMSFTLEFLGPDRNFDFQEHYFNFSYDDVQRLARGLKALPCLKIFRLRNSRMDEKKLNILTRHLKHIKTLETVDFGYDRLGDDCGMALASLFTAHCGIKFLELEHNALGRRAMKEFAHGLKTSKGEPLEYLGLAHNPLTDKGLAILCSSLIGTEHVQQINLSGIVASEKAVARYIGEMLLKQHHVLRSLDMRAIQLGLSFGRKLIRALATNNRIKHIDLRGCGIDLDDEFEAEIIVRRNKYIFENRFTNDETKRNEDIDEFLDSKMHPLLKKIDSEKRLFEKCIENRTTKSPSVVSLIEDLETVSLSNSSMNSRCLNSIMSNDSSEDSVHEDEPFFFDPNAFDLWQLREHMQPLGPKDRFYYLKKMKKRF